MKTLEEPPPHVKFLLATTDPQKLPVTVLSRCLQFNLKRLDEEQISGQITRILQAEGIGAEPGTVEIIDLKAMKTVATVDVPQQAAGIDFYKTESAK